VARSSGVREDASEVVSAEQRTQTRHVLTGAGHATHRVETIRRPRTSGSSRKASTGLPQACASASSISVIERPSGGDALRPGAESPSHDDHVGVRGAHIGLAAVYRLAALGDVLLPDAYPGQVDPIMLGSRLTAAR
jgi:hypothetical protein